MKQFKKWLMPAVLLVIGAIVFFFSDGHGFLGVVTVGIGVIISVYQLLYIWQRKHAAVAKVVRMILSVILILALLAATVTLVFILRGPEESRDADCKYLIILGAAIKDSTPSPILQDRLDRAYDFLQENPDVICIASGGKGSDENISEAQCIFNALTAKGIDGSRIWLEDRSTSTVENFRCTLELLEAKTGSRPAEVYVISNEFHLYRASLMAKDQGLTAHCIPAPTGQASIRISYTIREIFALWKYLIIGG